MKCIKCKKLSKYKVQNLDFCGSCFLKIIEKRIKKQIRAAKLFSKGDRICFVDDNSPEFLLSRWIFEKISKTLNISTVYLKDKYHIGKKIKGDFAKVIIPFCLDDEIEYLMQCISHDKIPTLLGHFILHDKRYVKLCLPLLHKEAVQAVEIMNIPYKSARKESGFGLDDLEMEFPGLKHSILKSSRYINKILHDSTKI